MPVFSDLLTCMSKFLPSQFTWKPSKKPHISQGKQSLHLNYFSRHLEINPELRKNRVSEYFPAACLNSALQAYAAPCFQTQGWWDIPQRKSLLKPEKNHRWHYPGKKNWSHMRYNDWIFLTITYITVTHIQ